MIQREDAFARDGRFWKNLETALNDGVRDIHTGYDRVAYDWLDPRVEGGGNLAYALTRALAKAWRPPVGHESIPVVVWAGSLAGGRLDVREVPLDLWPSLEEIHFAADGPATVTEHQAMARRFRIDGGAESLDAIFGSVEVPGDLTLVVGLTQGIDADHLLRSAAKATGVSGECVGILMLYQTNAGPVDVLDAGGPTRNCWHPGMYANMHLSNSHLSAAYLDLMAEAFVDNWYDQAFREAVFQRLKAATEERGLVLDKEGFLNALAEGSPLRKIFPHHLTRFFPELERIFWCLPHEGVPGLDPLVWDESSPFERLSLLSALKVDAYAG